MAEIYQMDTQKEILKEYRSLLIKKPLPTFRQICFPEKYTLQNPQKFVGKLMAPGMKTYSLLIFHKIGAGKSCAAIQICTRWIGRGRPLVVLPASLVPGFKNELRTPCSDKPYLTLAERAEMAALSPSSARYKQILRASDERIAADITIMSYNKFVTSPPDYPPVIIVDEVQNIMSADISARYYNALRDYIVAAPPTMRVVLMSATPIFDSPRQLAPLLTLMRFPETHPQSPAELKAALAAALPTIAISYFGGAPAYTFPAVKRKFIHCKFSRYQAGHYLAAAEHEMGREDDFFYTKSRQRSNIVYPNGASPTEGYAAITRAQLTTSLPVYSAKFSQWLARVNRPGLHFTFCEYSGASGIKIMCKILRADGWKNYFKDGPGKRRYAVWTGDQTPAQKAEMRAVFNHEDNDGAGAIKLLIGSAAMKEGVSLMRVRHAHIISPYWNQSYMWQVEGRCVRYCSAKSLPREKRKVTINYYIGETVDATSAPDPLKSVDWYILKRAGEKQAAIDEYTRVMKEQAIDRLLFQ